jgi:hypothetical protein
VLTNAPFMLNLDCDHYINNSKAVREAMCFLMDPQLERNSAMSSFLKDSMVLIVMIDMLIAILCSLM